MNVKSMSLEKLVKLKDQVDAALSSKVTETRRVLQSNLAKLSGFGSGSMRGRRGATLGSKVAPRYRNPENPSETWTGRGLKPRWLAAALKSGKKLEHFSIAESGAKATKQTRKINAKAARRATMKKSRASVRRRPAPRSSSVAAAES